MLREVGVDGRVAGFTALVSLATGVLFGIVPAIRASRAPLHDALKEGGRAGGGGVHGFAGRALVVSEVALSLVLLIAAGLLIHSFTRLQDVAPGFDSSRLLTFRLALPESRYTTFQKGQSFFDEFFAGIRRSSRRAQRGRHQRAAVQWPRRQPLVSHRGARGEAAGGSDSTNSCESSPTAIFPRWGSRSSPGANSPIATG